MLFRVAGLFLLLAALAAVLFHTDYVAVPLLLSGATLWQMRSIVGFVDQSNTELARFLTAVRYDDYSQSFSHGHLGRSFSDLDSAFQSVVDRFRAARSEREAERRYLEVLVEHVPIAILAVHDDSKVRLLNSAARQLLDAPSETNLDALDAYGATFQRDIAQSRPGRRGLTRAVLDGVERQLLFSTTQIALGLRTERLIALEDIQGELDASELSAWQDMVRVLSHEIGNSITPIASLARTTEGLVSELKAGAVVHESELIQDVHHAVDTIARRSEGLIRFVKIYGQLTKLPRARRQKVSLADYFERLRRLLVDEWGRRGVTLHIETPSAGLSLNVDEELLDRALVNIVKNAADATESADRPQVWVAARLSARGRAMIEVSDNGKGIAEGHAERIFTPFFTTKPDGSGVGLALARQVVLMHQGSIRARAREGGGTVFQLSF